MKDKITYIIEQGKVSMQIKRIDEKENDTSASSTILQTKDSINLQIQ